MKNKFNYTWMLIVITIVGNIIIFNFMSKKLSNYVYVNVASSNTLENI